ncbi:MAG: DNA mismatch repair protein MutS [Clostridia bacterium]|nr:DNA mismatch repair protein MutS [Clostridia bacterium]
MAEMTPMMRQYFEIKKEYSDTILMFRLGDFYEMFFDDAKTASRELELVLTGRDCGQEERAPMCGVPFHSADSYIARLVQKGYKVAICEQTEDPSLAKGLVRREVVRVITPGTVIESSMLDESRNNYLGCVVLDKKTAGVCFADVSTGEVHLAQLSGRDLTAKIINELCRFSPTEVLLSPSACGKSEIVQFVRDRIHAALETMDAEYFSPSVCGAEVLRHFQVVSAAELGIDGEQPLCALGASLRYLKDVQKSELENIRTVDFYSDARFMKIDASSRRNLELTETMRTREKRGTLLWVLDKTRTPMGKRLIRSWLEQPLLSIPRITRRQGAVEELLRESILRREIRASLADVGDMERVMARVVYGTANAKELKALQLMAEKLPAIKTALEGRGSVLLSELYEQTDTLDDVAQRIRTSIVEDPPFSVREGGMICDGFNAELDSLRSIVTDNKGFIASIQLQEQERTGIKKLKIGYNRVFGYYIEVPNAFKELVPETYIRKQTLANCERFITEELKALEAKVLSAQERITGLEYEIFAAVRADVADQFARIQKTAAAVAALDTLCSFAEVAEDRNYVCPQITDDRTLEIREGRHPVVERMLGSQPFVPNDTLLDCGENRCAIITGPNMAGKSTYMRQVALITLMAQIGSFVPAQSATIGVCDSIFTRVGASDDLASGQSTFMVEMSEVASILKNATSKSLIIFDEIGRGTSTFDGMSIARAVLEHAADPKKLGAKTLFATHYHELTELEQTVPGVRNYNIAVKKRGDDITFLRRIVRGGADGSYGIEVAKLAGVPNGVVQRAKEILEQLEEKGYTVRAPEIDSVPKEQDAQMTFGGSRESELVGKLRSMDVNTLTPIEALTELFTLCAEAKSI